VPKFILAIRQLTYILICISVFASCVTELPLRIEDEKYFAVCELKSNDRIIVRLNQSGNVSGELPDFINDPNSIKLTISEGFSDFAVNLVWDYDSQYYTCDPNSLVPKAGQFYTLKGLANYEAKETDPIVTMPNYPNLDSINATLVGTELIDGVSHNVYSFKTKISISVNKKGSFLHITPVVDGLSKVQYSFDVQHSAYKSLKHTDGFLVDYSRTKNGILAWTMKVPSDQQLKKVKINIANVDKTYYYYNAYRTDILSSVNSSYVSPVIIGDGLNVITSKAYASYSGNTVSTFDVTIK
jgi:hypothetical protein